LPKITIRLKSRKAYNNQEESVSHEFTLYPEDYLIEGKKIKNNLKGIDKEFLGLLSEECQMAFMPIEVPAPRGPIFVFGEYFLRKFYTVFDRDRNLIGFSLANHNLNSNAVTDEDVLSRLNIKTPYDDVDTDEINYLLNDNDRENNNANNKFRNKAQKQISLDNNRDISRNSNKDKNNLIDANEDSIEKQEKQGNLIGNGNKFSSFYEEKIEAFEKFNGELLNEFTTSKDNTIVDDLHLDLDIDD